MRRLIGVLSLVLAVIVTVCLPAVIAMAQGTTVEVNSGETITLEPGESIAASTTGGVSVEVKNLPDLGSPSNGLACFTIRLSWAPDVFHVNSVIASEETRDTWSIISGTPDNINGSVTVAGYTTVYSTDNVILLYLGITAVGENGDSALLNVAIINLGDINANPIPAEPVSAEVIIQTEDILKVTWLPPLTTEEIYTAQCGSTIPIKFQIVDTSGVEITDTDVTVAVTRNSDGAVVFSEMAVYQPDSSAFKVNIKTKGWETGEYTIRVSASEETQYNLNLVEKGKGKLKQNGK